MGAITVTDADFDAKVLQADRPVMVDFWASWCRPCIKLGPTVEEIAAAYAGRAIVAKVDVQHNPDVAVRYNIQSIPQLIFFKSGREVDRIMQAADRATIAARLDAVLG